MKALKIVFAFALAVLWAGAAFAQDPVKVDAKHYKVLVDNPSVRVLKITYPAGDKSPMHQHPDSMVVPLVTSKVRFTMPDGKAQDQELPNESATYTPAGTHSPANVGSGPIEAILVEFKSAAPGTATVPTDRPGLAIKVLAESPRAIAYRTIADATFSEPAGTKHDYDQIVIALNAAQMSLALDGKPPKTTWARGDVQFIGRGTAHESKNTGGKPVDFIIVAVK
jgi:quercetin dioxygenase-like cupin family protein